MAMTPDDLYALLRGSPGLSYAQLSSEARAVMREQLRSGVNGFTQQQTEWLRNFYLEIPDLVAFAVVIALLPQGLSLSPRTTSSDRHVLSADLLTDCLMPSDTWSAIATYLATLPIAYIPAADFPAPPPLDI